MSISVSRPFFLDFLQLPGKKSQKLVFVCATISHLLLLGMDWILDVARLSLNALRPSKINRGKTRKSTVTWRNSWLKKKTDHFLFFSFTWDESILGRQFDQEREVEKKEGTNERKLAYFHNEGGWNVFLQSRTHTRKKNVSITHFILFVVYWMRKNWNRKYTFFLHVARLLHY